MAAPAPRSSRSSRSRVPRRSRSWPRDRARESSRHVRVRLARDGDGQRCVGRHARLRGELLQPREPRALARPRDRRRILPRRPLARDERPATTASIPSRASTAASSCPATLFGDPLRVRPRACTSRTIASRASAPSARSSRAGSSTTTATSASSSPRTSRSSRSPGCRSAAASRSCRRRAASSTSPAVANVLRPDDSQLRHEVDADLTAIRYPQAGVRVALSERVALAAVYRGEFQLGLDLSAHLSGDISGLTTALYELETHSVNNFLPQQAVFGGSWLLTRNVRASFDATWIELGRLRRARRAARRRARHPAAGRRLAGDDLAAADARTDAHRAAAHARSDHPASRRGVARARRAEAPGVPPRWLRDTRRRPIDPQTGLTNYVDRDRHTFSLGLGADGARACARAARLACRSISTQR